MFGNQGQLPKRPVLDCVINRLRPRPAAQQLHLSDPDRMPARRQLPGKPAAQRRVLYGVSDDMWVAFGFVMRE